MTKITMKRPKKNLQKQKKVTVMRLIYEGLYPNFSSNIERILVNFIPPEIIRRLGFLVFQGGKSSLIRLNVISHELPFPPCVCVSRVKKC